ncbi:MAG: asparagine synthase-related protein [Candidatus Caldarchaeum sp.]|nr:asparagine synthase-related protein [Candidatus Caldarchaeum sp.]MDW7977318.1 asparagine synthase-related protein [Candidatus Caldarchaeum sp.]MDW8360370.1 asparagine synthase-related protein [Candidatus Caldarchaeum sp.]
MIRYLLTVGDLESRPRTFDPELSQVFTLADGSMAVLHVHGRGLSAETYHEAVVGGRAVLQVEGPSPSNFSEDLVGSDRVWERLSDFSGFSSGLIVGDDVMVFRDHVGLLPVYVVLSELKAVTNIPVEAYAWSTKPQPLQPGTLMKMSLGQASPTSRLTSVEGGAENLLKSLSRAILELCPKHHAVFFSGGLDSLIIAKLSCDLSLNPRLLTLGVRGSVDFGRSMKAAETLGLDVVSLEVDEVMVKEALEQLRPYLGSMTTMDSAIAAAMKILSKAAVEEGCSAAVSGQGADELFGGYKKYEKALVEHGYGLAGNMMRLDFSKLHEFGLPRDFIAVRSSGTYLITPYLSRRVVEVAYSTPLTDKISLENGRVVRKKVLRELCKNVGLGEFADLEKKALQYSSGLEKMLKRSGYPS